MTGANVTVTSAQGRQVARTLTSPAGRYTVTGLPAAAITVIVTAAGHEPPLELPAGNGQTRQADITLTRPE